MTMVAAPSMPRRLRLTRAHVAALMEAGLVQEARYELRDGELLEKMPQNKPHVTSCRRTTHALEDRFGRARGAGLGGQRRRHLLLLRYRGGPASVPTHGS